MDIKHALAWGAGVLESGTRRLDAEVLLAYVLGKSREYITVHQEIGLNGTELNLYKKFIQRRKKGEPVAYLTGKKEFFGLEFSVSSDCLIPRPETELLVEEIIKIAKNCADPRICDVGTGSGAIAVALARHLPRAKITATDISAKALDIAGSNARALLSSDTRTACGITFVQCDLLPDNPFDIVVANLPYLRENDPEIAEETKMYEPSCALYGGDRDGLGLIRKLFARIEAFTQKPAYVLGEFGLGQEEEIKKLLPDAEIKNDLAGIPRIFIQVRA